jgi:amino acid transporter
MSLPSGSALDAAIARSFAAEDTTRAYSPLRALGRRRLSGFEVLAQSVATTAPAASMVLLPVTILRHGSLAGGIVTIAAATLVMSMLAVCISQFTRRMAAAGGLYSFVAQGVGPRSALSVGAAMAVKYCGSAALTLYHGGQALTALLLLTGIDARGPFGTVLVYGCAAVVLAGILLRGVRFAAIAIMVIEVCSLAFIGVMLAIPDAHAQTAIVPPTGASHGLLLLTLAAVFSLAGFESATFFGPETRKSFTVVTRTVLWTPLICGALFTLAAIAVWSGRGNTLINAYLHGTGTGVAPLVVAAVNVALMCSWWASAMASFNASSRLLYTMGVERLLPSPFRLVHSTFRTPFGALLIVIGGVGAVSCALALLRPGALSPSPNLSLVARGCLVVAYVTVAAASVLFLRRIGESTAASRVAAVLAGVSGAAVLAYFVAVSAVEHNWPVLLTLAAVVASGPLAALALRRLRPAGLRAVGVFDSADSDDALPGSVSYGTNRRGEPALVSPP